MLRGDNMGICVTTEMGRELGLVDDERWARFNGWKISNANVSGGNRHG